MAIPYEIQTILNNWSPKNTRLTVKNIRKALNHSEEPHTLIENIIKYVNSRDCINNYRYTPEGILNTLSSGAIKMVSQTVAFQELNRELSKLQKKCPQKSDSIPKTVNSDNFKGLPIGRLFVQALVFVTRLLPIVATSSKNLDSIKNMISEAGITIEASEINWVNYLDFADNSNPENINDNFMEATLQNYELACKHKMIEEFTTVSSQMAVKIIDKTNEVENPNLLLAAIEFDIGDYREALKYATQAYVVSHSLPALRLRQYIRYIQDPVNAPSTIEDLYTSFQKTADYIYSFHEKKYMASPKIMGNMDDPHLFEMMLYANKKDKSEFTKILDKSLKYSSKTYDYLIQKLNPTDPVNNVAFSAYQHHLFYKYPLDKVLVRGINYDPTNFAILDQILISETMPPEELQFYHRHKIILLVRSHFHFGKLGDLPRAVADYQSFLLKNFHRLSVEKFFDSRFTVLLDNPSIHRDIPPRYLLEQIDEINRIEKLCYAAVKAANLTYELFSLAWSPLQVGIVVGIFALYVTTQASRNYLKKRSEKTSLQRRRDERTQEYHQKNIALTRTLARMSITFSKVEIIRFGLNGLKLDYKLMVTVTPKTQIKIRKLMAEKLEELVSKMFRVESLPMTERTSGLIYQCMNEASFAELDTYVKKSFLNFISSEIQKVFGELYNNALSNMHQTLDSYIVQLTQQKNELQIIVQSIIDSKRTDDAAEFVKTDAQRISTKSDHYSTLLTAKKQQLEQDYPKNDFVSKGAEIIKENFKNNIKDFESQILYINGEIGTLRTILSKDLDDSSAKPKPAHQNSKEKQPKWKAPTPKEPKKSKEPKEKKEKSTFKKTVTNETSNQRISKNIESETTGQVLKALQDSNPIPAPVSNENTPNENDNTTVVTPNIINHRQLSREKAAYAPLYTLLGTALFDEFKLNDENMFEGYSDDESSSEEHSRPSSPELK